jgi:hypothetical protein
MDTEKGEATTGSSDIAASDTSVSQVLTIDPKREAKLLRKLDLSIAPIVLVIFLAAYIDRANLGNAASAGMSEDIGMSSAELGSAYIRYRTSFFIFDTSLTITLQTLSLYSTLRTFRLKVGKPPMNPTSQQTPLTNTMKCLAV